MYDFPVDGPVPATVRISSGRLRVHAESRASIGVDVQPGSSAEAARQAADQTRVEMTPEGLLIETPQQRGFMVFRSAHVNITLRVPHDTRLMVRSSSADIDIDGRIGSCDINSASGDLRVEHVAGDLQRGAASGDTQFGRVDGDLAAHGASGDVRGGTVGGDYNGKSASGDITIEAIGGSARANSASGDIRLGNLARGEARVHTASGDVTLGVAEGTAVWMDLSTVSGSTRSELDISDTPAGTGATLSIHARTASGDITIRRARTAPAERSAGAEELQD